MATARTATLLQARTVDLSATRDHTTGRRSIGALVRTLRFDDNSLPSVAVTDAVIYTILSPSLPGHLRDRRVLRRLTGGPLYGVVHHGDFAALFTRWPQRVLAPRLVQKLDGIIFLDTHLSQACAEWIPSSKRFVIPNTLDEDSFPVFASRIPSSENWNLLFLSNMIPLKGYLTVLEAVAVLRQRGRPVKATFAGHWPDDQARSRFEHRARSLGIEERIRIFGPVTDRAVVQTLHAEADVFVLPTAYPTEAQPLTIIEALANGTPVISTMRGGIPGMLDEGVEGCFVPPQDSTTLADAVEWVMHRDRWGKMSKAARARFDRQFHPAVVRQQWLDLLGGTLPNA